MRRKTVMIHRMTETRVAALRLVRQKLNKRKNVVLLNTQWFIETDVFGSRSTAVRMHELGWIVRQPGSRWHGVSTFRLTDIGAWILRGVR